jgi:hypothetical protein
LTKKNYLAQLFAMKNALLHTAYWLILACVSAANLRPLVWPDAMAKPQPVVIDAQNDSLPAEGKEQKTEWFKNIAAPAIPIASFEKGFDARQYCGQPQFSRKQVFLPVLLPPPKLAA